MDRHLRLEVSLLNVTNTDVKQQRKDISERYLEDFNHRVPLDNPYFNKREEIIFDTHHL